MLAAVAKVRGDQDRVQFVLGDARPDGVPHVADGHVGHAAGEAYERHLVLRLNGPCLLRRHTTVGEADTLTAQPFHRVVVELVEPDPLVGNAQLPHYVLHVGGPGPSRGLDAASHRKVVEDAAWFLAKKALVIRLSRVERKQNRLALPRDQGIVHEKSHAEDAGGANTGGVPNVDRVEEQDCAEVSGGHLLLEPGQPLPLQPRHVDSVLVVDNVLPHQVQMMSRLAHRGPPRFEDRQV